MEGGLHPVIVVGGGAAQHVDDLLLTLVGVIAQGTARPQHQLGDELQAALVFSGVQHPDDLSGAGAPFHLFIELAGQLRLPFDHGKDLL